MALSPAAASEPASRSASLLENARNDFGAGNFDGALASLDQIDKAEKGNADSLDLRGLIYLEQGKFEDAKKAFRAANESNPAHFSSQLHLGDLLLREKKFEEARDVYETRLREKNVRAASEKLRYAILLTYLLARDEARARTALERIKFPTETPAYYYAQAAWEFAHERPKEARQWIKAAQRMFDPKVSAWFSRPLHDFGWVKEKPPMGFP